MPNLDLIIQAKQEVRAFGRADPAAAGGPTNTATNTGSLLLICCRSSKLKNGASMNGCSPPRLFGTRLACFRANSDQVVFIDVKRHCDPGRPPAEGGRSGGRQFRAAGRSVGRDCFVAQALLAMTAPTWSISALAGLKALALDEAGPQQAGLSVGIAGDAAGGIQDHRRAIR
jgi:hypothetical protein